MACIVNRPGRHDVGPAQERDLLVAGVQEGRDRPGDDPAVDAEPGVRRQEDPLDVVVLVQRVPLVDDVVRPAADQRRDRDDDHPVDEDLLVLAGAPGEPDHDEVGRGEADRVADPVPADGQRAELERRGVREEVKHPRKCSGRRHRPRPVARRADRTRTRVRRPRPYTLPVNAEFNWWLLIVGLVVGAGLVWFVVADSRRREADVDADERPREALWLSAVLGEEGHDVTPDAAAAAARAPPGVPRRAAPRPPARRRQVAETSGPDRARRSSPSASTSETPNVAIVRRPATAGDGPTQ